MLLKNPAFTLVALLSLAVGIGINTVMFSIVDGVLLKRLPFRNPERLVSLVDHAEGIGSSKLGLTRAEFVRFREQSQSLEQVAAYYGQFYINYSSFRDPANPYRFRNAAVTINLFSVLGYQPYLGRGFTETPPPPPPPGAQPGEQAPLEVILSYALWQKQYGGDSKVLNRVVRLSGTNVVIVGVMPPDFQLPGDLINDDKFQVFYPFYPNPARIDWSFRGLTVVGSLRPGKKLSNLQAEAPVILNRLKMEKPEAYPPSLKARLSATSLRDDLVGSVNSTLLLLMGAVGVVLLIACLNVASLLLARATGRQKEMALRATLGASRGKLVRQLLCEALLLAAGAASLGLLLAHSSLGLVLALTPVGALPRAGEVTLDWRVLLFMLAASVAAALLFGLVPALQVSRIELNRALREEGRSATGGVFRQRLRSVLVIGEVSLAFVLVIGAGLLLRSFSKLLHTDLGFDPHHVVTARIQLRGVSNYNSRDATLAFFDNFHQEMLKVPGVTAAGATDTVPLGGRPGADTMFDIEGRTLQQSATSSGVAFPHVYLSLVLSDYFTTIGSRLISGRVFTEQDQRDGLPAAIINETMMHRFFPNDNPIGKRVRLYFGSEQKTPWLEVIGVVADNKMSAIDEEPRVEMFIPGGQLPKLLGNEQAYVTNVNLLVKANAGMSAAKFREVMRGIDPQVSIFDVEPVDSYIARVLARPRFILTLLVVFAAVAFLLAVVGIYGLISYSVTQRTREFGIRMALGAQRSNILRLIVGQATVLACIGVFIGLAASFVLTRVIRSLLFGVSATDPLTFLIATLVLLVVAALASFLPARRASRVDPMRALRVE